MENYEAEIRQALLAIPVNQIRCVKGFDVKHHKGNLYSDGFGKKRTQVSFEECLASIVRIKVYAKQLVTILRGKRPA